MSNPERSCMPMSMNMRLVMDSGILGYNFLLEHDGSYQAFDYGIGEIFRLETQEFYIKWSLNRGMGVILMLTAYWSSGTRSENMEIILFDFDENREEYDAYITGENYFDDLVNECAKELFDEYYCSYNIDGKRYVFENGVSVIITQDSNRAYMNDAGIIEVAALVKGRYS